MARHFRYSGKNSLGQFEKGASILITKELLKVADELDVRIKPLVRDELERTYRSNLYASYQPISEHGEQVKQHNENKKYKLKNTYHHTGILASHVKGLIDGNAVKVVIEYATYPDGKTTEDVYNILKNGTKEEASSKYYTYDGKWATYHQTPKHTFEKDTLEHMEMFLTDLENGGLKNLAKFYKAKYKKKKRSY